MGTPWFQIRHLAESDGLVALSANFAVYSDLSDRMMSLAAGLGPAQEIYSIDESFIDLTGVRGNLIERSHKIRDRILQWVTDAGIAYLADTAQLNRNALSKHEGLVEQVARCMQGDGRIVWRDLSLRAWLPPQGDIPGCWRITRPDVFSIRNTSVQAYLEPSVHEIKVRRADLLGDLKKMEKRGAYLEVGGQCWYVLGCDAKGKPIADESEIPFECGVMVSLDGKLEVIRTVPKRPANGLPFAVWMALAKALPVQGMSGVGNESW
jgi:hypothetical protein